MIQRIQTVYLILAVIALIACMCLPVGTFVSYETFAWFNNWGVTVENSVIDSSPWGMLAILLLSAVISVATIFLYKNRMLQIRLSVFNIILLVGYYIVFAVFTTVLKNRLGVEYRLSWALCLPFVAMVLIYLAIRGIAKDEVMVRAADRLR